MVMATVGYTPNACTGGPLGNLRAPFASGRSSALAHRRLESKRGVAPAQLLAPGDLTASDEAKVSFSILLCLYILT